MQKKLLSSQKWEMRQGIGIEKKKEGSKSFRKHDYDSALQLYNY